MATTTKAKKKSLTELLKEINMLDMKRAELYVELRANSEYCLNYINLAIAKLVGKYYKTPNDNLIYGVNSGKVEAVKQERGYKAVLSVTKYDASGASTESTYEITSPTLPKNVDSWLTMGNEEVSAKDAKKYITTALLVEKKKLEERIKEIEKKIK